MKSWNVSSLDTRRRVVFLCTLMAMTATIVWTFGRQPALGPTSPVSQSVHWIPLTPGLEIAQTFAVPWNDLQRVQLHVRASDRVSGILQLDIDRLVPKSGVVVDSSLRTVQTAVGTRTNGETYTVAFLPISDSGGQFYRARVSVPELHDGSLAVASNRHDAYRAGSLSVNGRHQDGDLVFTAVGPNSSLAELLRSAMRGRPWPFSSPALLWILLSVFSLALSQLVVVAAETTGALEKKSPRRNDR